MKLLKAIVFLCFLYPFVGYTQIVSNVPAEQRELIAKNMLLYQRSNGGWPKHFKEKAVDYSKSLNAEELALMRENYASGIDATIDNNATIKEIRFLASQFTQTNKTEYLEAVQKGIAYLLSAQYDNGGWPQFYPDKRNYRHFITYNDNAMINVLNLLTDVKNGKADMGPVDKALVLKASKAIEKGIDCILKTQIKVNGKLTVWCAQHDEKTLEPANARAFELRSLSGSESVGIVQFLMKQDQPSAEIKNAVNSAVEWFEKVKIPGYKFVAERDPEKGRQQRLIKDDSSVVWARFYEIETNEPFFTGRDGVKKKSVDQIDAERRNGYAWYGSWPQKVIQEYPKWASKNSVSSVFAN